MASNVHPFPTTRLPANGGRQLLGVDWGTSNRRAYLVDPQGGLLARHSDDQGMLAARPHFARSLAALLARMGVADGVPVVASGMVGSALGWREVPYLDIAVPLEELPRHLAVVEEGGRTCLIVPGYAQRAANGGGRVDVMRGEETQLLGAIALGHRDGWMVLPGTHSKWVLLKDGVVQRIATFMTGELFALLQAQGTLAPLMEEGDGEQGFIAGLDEARACAAAGSPLSNSLFGVRARVVTGALPAAHARGFVSGLLIGTEYAAALAQLDAEGAPVIAIGSPSLQERYARAAERFGIPLRGLEPDHVYCAALARILSGLNE
jgi:2-dehydro-3-deoxygalactonokinase